MEIHNESFDKKQTIKSTNILRGDIVWKFRF